ncbi:MAG: PAS domain-containing protein [Deltaproteobacteria bacterium]|nr:PAS domain-containing protein [Deltaproteobacteria bacterium]MBI3388742.1 PAS domain-containing protein [Deltaproteobacteria bacterium]
MLNLAQAIPPILLAATGGSFWLAWYFWKNRGQPGAIWFGGCLLSCGLWTSLDALSFLLDVPPVQELARRAAWAVILSVTVCFFRFACIYAQRTRWWRVVRAPVVGALAGEIMLMATNAYHHLMWQPSEWTDMGFVRIPALVPGPAFYWLHLPLTYGLILGGVAVLFAHTIGSPTFYVRRTVLLSLGMMAPLIVNLFVVSRLTRGIDLTPLALLVTFAAVAWVTFHDRLLDVMPAVRSLLFQQHRDAVIVLDEALRVIDANPAARLLLGDEGAQGALAAALLPFWSQVREVVERGDGDSIEIAHDGHVIEIRSLRIRDETRATIGRLVALHDVTERARLIRELDAYARTVAHDLKNPLTAAAGYLELVGMMEPQLNEESARSLSRAEEACHQMARIIDDLLRRRSVPPPAK